MAPTRVDARYILRLSCLRVGVAARTIVLNGNSCPSRPCPLGMLSRTPCMIYYSNTTGRCVHQNFHPSTVVKSKSSLSPRGQRQFTKVFRHIGSRRAGSRAGTVHFLRTRKGQRVIVMKTANGHRSRALNGVDLLVSCVRRKLRIRVVASRNVFVPTYGARMFASRPKRRISVFGFKTAKLRKRKLTCPLDSFDG